MAGVIGNEQSNMHDLKAGQSATFLQLAAPPYGEATLKRVALSAPDYHLPESSPALANITVTIEQQNGGAFANAGLIPHRVRGGDPAKHLSARYRSVVREEPSTVKVLKEIKAPLLSGKEIVIEDLGDIKATPTTPIGIKIKTDADVRIWYVDAHHEE